MSNNILPQSNLSSQQNIPSKKLNTATILKTSAMAVSIPRYVGILFYASGLGFNGAWGFAHYAELIAGVCLALLEGFALSYMVDRVQLNTSKIEQAAIIAVALLLLILLPLAAIPSMYFAFIGASLFASFAGNVAQVCFTCAWLFAVAAMPILIILGVGLTQSDPLERQLQQSIKRATTEQEIAKLDASTKQVIAEIEARTQQIILQYQLQNRQTKASYKQQSSRIEQQHEQDEALPFACVCNQRFATVKALSGHKANCDQWKQGQANGKAELEQVGVLQ